MRQAEAVAGRARGQHGLGRAAGALGIGAVRVEPEAQRRADGLEARLADAEERDRAVDAAAHRDHDPVLLGGRRDDLRERLVQRVAGERWRCDRGGLERRQAGKRGEKLVDARAFSPGLVDAPLVDPQPDPGEVAVTCSCSGGLHRARVAARFGPRVHHRAVSASYVRNLASQVGALPGGD